MTAMQKDHQRDKDGCDEQVSKLKEEIRQLKSERTHMETKAHEMEAVSWQNKISLVPNCSFKSAVSCAKTGY